MRIVLEDKLDHLFKNSKIYDKFKEEIKKMENIEDMGREWERLKEYFMEGEAFEYGYKYFNKKDNEGEYIYLRVYRDINENKIMEMKEEEERKRKEKLERIEKKYRIEEDIIKMDMRITEEMIILYKEALEDTECELIKNPHYILDNMKEIQKEFYEYLINIIDNKDMCGIQKKVMLENGYTNYMSHMTGIPIKLLDGMELID